MRYDVQGFKNYEIDDDLKLYSKTREVRWGTSSRTVTGQQIKPTKYGCYVLYNGARYRFTPEEVWARRIEKHTEEPGMKIFIDEVEHG